MNRYWLRLLPLLLLALPLRAEVKSLDELLLLVKANRSSERQLDQQREAEFLADSSRQQQLLAAARAERDALKAQSLKLQQQLAAQQAELAAQRTLLAAAKGNLDEMFAVVRQAAEEGAGLIGASLVSAQQPGREVAIRQLAAASELPTLAELEALWLTLQGEMTESGKVVAFSAAVAGLDGGSASRQVIRIGTFNLISQGDYLSYPGNGRPLQPLGRQPGGAVSARAADFSQLQQGTGAVYLDPSRGQILSLLTAKATLTERFYQGGVIGYVIALVMLLGLVVASYKLATLLRASLAIMAQLKRPEQPDSGNALGRVLKVYQDNRQQPLENLELRLDEAILRETPWIEAGIPLLKILAAVAPLLGLLGTVVGMIDAFQQITLFGAGDPQLLASAISMALVTTAQGLIAAIPLLLLHSLAAARAKAIIHILDEQSTGIIAAQAEQERH